MTLGATMKEFGRWPVGSMFAYALMGMATPALAAPEQKLEWNLGRQDLDGALRAIGRSSRREIIFRPEAVKGWQAPPLNGTYTALEAVETVLRGTRLTAVERDGTILIRQRFSAASDDALNSGENIVVTGSRIRGAPSTSPVTTVTREDAMRSGQTDLGQLIRDLPQNFAGGQSPTIAGSGQGGFTNVSGSSALNLRGLGADASLTLINGHRVAFDATDQAVDISAIPLAAIERVDVVMDGASALYGSDAVGGVANVVLRRSVDGLITSTRIGAPTDGGGFTQQYNMVGGPDWGSGSIMIAADYQKSDEIAARHRSYTSNLPSDSTLIPAQKQISLILAGQQQISNTATFEIDGHYMHRAFSSCMPYIVGASCYTDGNALASTVDSWSISPSLRFTLPSTWEIRVAGTYSKSDTSIANRAYDAGVEISLARPDYANQLSTIEVGGEGPLFSLPGGDVRLALGGGYRSNKLRVDSRRFVGGIEAPINIFDETRNVVFGYGEIFLPLVSPHNNISAINKFNMVGAIRYEDHRKIQRILTPKLGFIYAPIDGIEFKASWGKSFKAPTLYQTGQTSNAQLVRGSIFNPAPESSYPVLYLYGGNSNLKPERSTTWTISTTVEPKFVNGLRLGVSYFRIRYRDRVSSPLSPITSALQSIYADYVQLNPTSEQVLTTIDSINGVFSNFSGQSFSASNVSAILNDRLQNISLEAVQGIDATVDYSRDLGTTGSIALKGSLSYLDSRRVLTRSQPSIEQAGVIFRPPHWRGRLNAGWKRDNVAFTATGNYIGSTLDNRYSPFVKVGSFVTLDTVATIQTTASRGIYSNVTWTVGVQNLFNEKPALVRTTDPVGLRYDSINQSTYGRVISLTLSKAW
ncbi:TonB-dependent receptor [Sphingobium sp. H39-3-25]|uniref:TonB-dependent receptor domain-containing protein n=1 Tax=Sphingobium arseniciresistens TaxID=3030834 RepID=UPI0023B99716|nr:TonB-dependent receptor [Sphingobium arseniciresistens]